MCRQFDSAPRHHSNHTAPKIARLGGQPPFVVPDMIRNPVERGHANTGNLQNTRRTHQKPEPTTPVSPAKAGAQGRGMDTPSTPDIDQHPPSQTPPLPHHPRPQSGTFATSPTLFRGRPPADPQSFRAALSRADNAVFSVGATAGRRNKNACQRPMNRPC